MSDEPYATSCKDLGTVIGVLVLLFGAGFTLIESGEVIVPRGLPEEGHDLRLSGDPRVELSRGDVGHCREAIPLQDQPLGGRNTRTTSRSILRLHARSGL